MKIIESLNPALRQLSGIFLLTSILTGGSVTSMIMAQSISAGGNMIIGSGVVVNSNHDVSMQGGGTLKVMGTLILKNNLVNQKTSPDSLGSGTIEFSGTTSQTVSGPNIFANLKIDNSAGVTLTGTYDNQVYGALTLTNGLLTLGSRNLLLGSAATIAGTPNAASMVVASGTGELRKSFSAPASFTYPVGDNTGTADYSPVTLNFTSGTFGTGNYVGVSLVNAKYPDANITGSYLNRYWKVTQNAVTGFICTTTFKYVDLDIIGTEANLFCLKTDPAPYITYSAVNTGSNLLTASALSTFSNFTGAMGSHEVNLTAFLEGPHNSGAMNTTLRDNDLIPTSQQPYTGSPWNYSGGESVGSIPAEVVDWVLIELRQADIPANANATTVIKKRAAFIKSDGSIVDLDGISPVRFYNTNITQNLYPVVKHRNHLAIMAASGVTKSGGIYTHNFTDSGSKTYGYPNGIKQVGSSWCMYGGNGSPDADINTDDISFSWNLQFGNYGYYSGDFSLNGSVDTDDISFFWNPNFGSSGGILDKTRSGYHSMVP